MTFAELMAMLQRILNYEVIPLKDGSLTLGSLLVFISLLFMFGVVAGILRKALLRVLKKTQMEEGTRYVLARITQYVIMIIGSIVALQFIGVNLGALAVIFGFLSVGIGFGLQNITSNFISGLIILFERPIKVGDRLIVNDIEGDVVEINIRSTTIRTPGNVHIIVPNSDFISNSVVNWSFADKKVRLDIAIGVSYSSDLDTVLKALEEVGENCSSVMKRPAPEVIFVEFGASSWDLKLRVWISDPSRHHNVRSEVNCEIVRVFKKYDIEIPFPQRDLHVRSPLPVPLATSQENGNAN